MELKEIVSMAQKGDTAALNQLYETYSKRIYFLCLKMLPGQEDAEDIAQDTFCTMIEKIHTLENPAAFESWLQTIAVNKCKNYLQKKKPQLIADDEKENIENMVTTEDDDYKELLPQSKLDNDETLRIIDEIVDGLSEKHRMTIMMYYYCDMSIKEIAEKLGCSIGTVKSRMNYAREQVRKSVLMYEKQGIKLYSGDILSVLREALIQLSGKVSVPDSISSAVQITVNSANGISASVIGNAAISRVSTSVSTSVANTVSHAVSSKVSVTTSVAVVAMCVGIGIGVVVPQTTADSDSVQISEVVKTEVSTVIQEEVRTVHDVSTVYIENDPSTLTSTIYETVLQPINTVETSTVYVEKETSDSVIDNTSYYDITTDDGFTFRIYDKNNTATLVSYDPEKSKSEITDDSQSSVVKIPDKADGFPVTRISNNAFKSNTFETVSLPDTITSISSGAFCDCENLKEINIPESVTEIPSNAFYGCLALETVTMGDNVYSIGNNAFKYCRSLKNINLSKNLTEIGDSAFSGCTEFDIGSLPEAVVNIGDSAFGHCGITDIDLSDNNIVSMGESVFLSCSDLENVKLPATIKEIGRYAFSYCSALKSLTIPDGVVSIGYEAFYSCDSLGDIYIPESVITVDYSAFVDCGNLKYIYGKPGSMAEKIAERSKKYYATFTDYENQTYDEIFVFDDQEYDDFIFFDNQYICENGIVFSKDKTELVKYPSIREDTEYIIPDTVTKICDGAFYGCKSLKNITVPQSVQEIGADAFDGTEWYDDQPDGVVYVGNIAYKYKGEMSSNENIVLKDGTTDISDNAFYNCHKMTSITIPNSVTNIGDLAYGNCKSLTSVEISDGLTSIGDFAFSGCLELKNIKIPNSLTSVGDFAFYDCMKLVNIKIPDSITNIGVSAFAEIPEDPVERFYPPYYDSQAHYITFIDDNYIVKDDMVFTKDNTKLVKCLSHEFYDLSEDDDRSQFKIPDSVTSIGDYAFYGCKDISIDIPDSVTSIGDCAFCGCKDISIDIPDSVTSIGDYAFYGCKNLDYIEIPNSVTSIGDYTFYVCEDISIDIPDSVTSIGESAFNNNITLFGKEGSAAQLYAKQNNIKFEII